MSIQFKIEKDGENLRYVDTTSNLERRTKDLIKYINNPKEHQKLYLVYKYIHDNGGLNDNGGWKIMEINEGNEDERDGLDACNLQMVLKPKIYQRVLAINFPLKLENLYIILALGRKVIK